MGRYSDALNPCGDILPLACAWCVTNPKGQLMLGLPTCGEDLNEWNDHRCYSSNRWPLTSINWAPIDGAKDHRQVVENPGRLEPLGSPHLFRKVSPSED